MGFYMLGSDIPYKNGSQDCYYSGLCHLQPGLLQMFIVWNPIIIALSSKKRQKLCCMHHHPCVETESYIPHSAWSALAAAIKQLIDYKNMQYKALNGMAPAHMADLTIP